MTDAALVGRLLDEYHERSVAPAGIHVVAGSARETRVTFGVTLSDETGQVIRAFRADEPVPVQGRGADSETVADWLLRRARTLAFLESARYAAPRPVRTRTGELIGVAGIWLSWAMSYVPGELLRPTLSQLRSLGQTLAQLHAVPAARGDAGRPGHAPRHPAVAVPATLARLAAVVGLVPAAWRPMYDSCGETAETVGRLANSVPETCVHGDAWARHAVQLPRGGPVRLIDWETGGLGVAVVDLGNCLAKCHLDSAVTGTRPGALLIVPDEDRIEAVASGYASERRLSVAERALLPAALRFGAAVAGATHLELAVVSGVRGAVMDARLACLQNRLAVADEIAGIALRYL